VAGVDPDVDEALEAALLAYAQRRAARWGAERFEAEFRRRDEEDGGVWTGEAFAAPVDASVQAQVVEGEPAVFRPEPPRIGFEPLVLLTQELTVPPPLELLPELLPEPAPLPEPEPVTELKPVAQPVSIEPEPAAEPEPIAPAMRHPHVPRPPAPAPRAEPQRRTRRGSRRHVEPDRASVITAPEWARMSPGARRLYGLEEPPGARRAG
jgi:hypothetical protein